MSLETTVAAVLAAIEGVAGIENVRARPGVPTDRDLAEDSLLADDVLQRWTVHYSPVATYAELSGGHPELDVQVVAVWSYREDEDTFAHFASRLAAVQLALLGALKQIDEQAIEVLESPGDPVAAEPGYSVYRSVMRFHLLDTVHT